MPTLDDAATLASLLHEDDTHSVIDGCLLPHHTSVDGGSSYDRALGITAHWHSATQDVDFERKLPIAGK